MTDENFRDGFCDDIFRSMKAQMEPSDDTVAALLAKIAAETPSSATENDNVIPFRSASERRAEETAAAAAVLESIPEKHFAGTRTGTKKRNKSIWYYGTAVAASIIVMISTFALLDTDSEDASGMQELFEQATGSNTQIVDSNIPDEDSQAPGSSETEESLSGDGSHSSGTEDSDTDGKSEKDSEGSSDSEPSGKDSSGDTASVAPETASKPGSDEKPENPDDKEGTSENKPADTSSGSENTGSSSGSSNGKVTPGVGEIPWTNEIISTSQVASISVSGTNYVVENTASRSDVGATLETVTITLPQTSTTNAAEVKARVCALKNVSSDAMVALDVEGFDQPLIYANDNYVPTDLEQFVSDLGLEGNIAFSSTVRCQISRMGYSSNQNYNVDISSAVWDYLLSQGSAARSAYSNFSSGSAKAMFTSAKNPTGSQMQFGVSDSGYLYIQVLGKKHTFHIGEANAKGFIEYVTGEPLE